MGFDKSKVDADNGIIYDVVMVEEGEAKGHGVHLDADFVEELVSYNQRFGGLNGLKARFGHPSACNDAMGSQLGFFRDVRQRKAGGKMQAIANLHLLEAADESPTHPNMRAWVLKMAEESPDFIMSSIAFAGSGYYQRKKNGHKQFIKSQYDADPELGDVYVHFGEEGRHYYTDLVESGAATESLFSNKVNPHLFVAQADEFLANNPELKAFMFEHPDKVTAFLASVGIELSPTTPTRKKMPFSISEWLLGKQPEKEESPELVEIRTALEAAKADMRTLKSDFDDAKEEIEQLNSSLAEAQARIKELEAQPAAEPTGGSGEPQGGAPEKSYHQNPIYRKYAKKAINHAQ